MKKRLTRGEKLLFASPLLFLAMVWVASRPRQSKLPSLELPPTTLLEEVRFSPDSKRLVVLSRTTQNQQIGGQVFDAVSHTKICDLEMPANMVARKEIEGPIWSGDGKRLFGRYYTAAAMNTPNTATEVLMWDTKSGALQVESSLPLSEAFSLRDLVRFAPDGKNLIGKGVPPLRYDPTTFKRLNRPDSGVSQNRSVAKLNEKLGLLAMKTGVDLTGFRVVDYKTKQLIWKQQFSAFAVTEFDWYGDMLCINYRDTPNGDQFPALDSIDNRILIWDGKTRQMQASPLIPVGMRLEDVNCNPQQSLVALFYSRNIQNSTQREGKVVVWNYRTAREIWSYETPNFEDHIEPDWRSESSRLQKNLQWSPDGKWLSAVHAKDTGWNLSVFDAAGNLQTEREPVSFYVHWSPDGKKLTSFSFEANRSTGKPISSSVEILHFED